jgi:hypothetical protein
MRIMLRTGAWSRQYRARYALERILADDSDWMFYLVLFPFFSICSLSRRSILAFNELSFSKWPLGGGFLFDETDVVGDIGGICLCFITGGYFSFLLVNGLQEQR